MSMKNKKLPNFISLVLNINLLSKKLPSTQNFTKIAKICIKTDLERRRVKQIYQKYRQNKWQRLSNYFQLRLLHYRSKQRLENFFSEKFREFSIGFFKKIIFYWSQYENDSWYSRRNRKLSEFYYFWKKNEKKTHAYEFAWPNGQKSRKMRFFAAGLSKHHRSQK